MTSSESIGSRYQFINIAGALQLLWGGIEFLFMILSILWAAGLVGSPYPDFIFPTAQEIMSVPLLTALIMGMMGYMRIMGGIGLFRDKLWGLALTLVVSFWTMMGIVQMAPPAIIDALVCSLIVTFALMGYFGNKSLTSIGP